MSWSYNFIARTKDAAKLSLSKRANVTPAPIQSALVLMIDALPDREDVVVSVETSGHIDASWGNSKTEVKLIPVE